MTSVVQTETAARTSAGRRDTRGRTGSVSPLLLYDPDPALFDVGFGGLLGRAPVMALHAWSSAAFIRRGGRIPAPLPGLNN